MIPRNCHQTATVKLAGNGLCSLMPASRLARPIRCGVLPHALDQVRLARSDVEEYQRRPVWRSAIRLPRLDQLGADVQIAREHRLRRVKRRSQTFHRAAVQRLGRKRERRRSQAALALHVLERFMGRAEKLGKHLILHASFRTHLYYDGAYYIVALRRTVGSPRTVRRRGRLLAAVRPEDGLRRVLGAPRDELTVLHPTVQTGCRYRALD
jgi:hypothetical protein